MEFLQEILTSMPDGDAAEIVNTRCYTALAEIKRILDDGSLSDFECIERIVCVFEEMGSDGGSRHDF